MNKSIHEKVLFGCFVTMVIGVIMFMVISLNEYNEKIKEYKTPNEWALEAVKEDFFTIREEDEIYIYEIREEMSIGNSNHGDELENYGEYIKLFYVKMIDDSFNVEEYFVLISYNIDKSFWANFRRFIGVKNELIGLEHIIYVDVDEL